MAGGGGPGRRRGGLASQWAVVGGGCDRDGGGVGRLTAVAGTRGAGRCRGRREGPPRQRGWCDCEAAVLVLQGVVSARRPGGGAAVRMPGGCMSGAASAAHAGELATAKSRLLRGAAVDGRDVGGEAAATADACPAGASPLGRGAIPDGE